MPSASSGYTAKEQSVGGLLANVAYLEAKEVNLPVFSIAAYSRSISSAAAGCDKKGRRAPIRNARSGH